MNRFFSLGLMTVFIVLFCAGCGFFVKPFEIPKYEEVNAKETAFVLPMEGDANTQDVFASAELLKNSKRNDCAGGL